MAGAGNVVEIRLRAVDEFSKGFSGLQRSLGGLRAVVGAALASVGVGALVRNMIEAEDAAKQLDSAFKATGATLGRTRSDLDDLASEMQRTTTLSDDLVKSAESILLTFDRVRGDAFERTIKAAADLSTRFGGDLPSAVRQLGRALQDPERGLLALTRAGVTFTDAQRGQIKTLLESGEALKAQDLILSEVERRFGGAAVAARDTLGGALKGLNNTVSDLFEGDRGGFSGLTKSVNAFSDSLANPKVKEGIDTLITGISDIASVGVQAISILGRLGGSLADLLADSGSAIKNWYDNLPEPTRAGLETGLRGLAQQVNPLVGRIVDAQFAKAPQTQQNLGVGRPPGGFTGRPTMPEDLFDFDEGEKLNEFIKALNPLEELDLSAAQRELDELVEVSIGNTERVRESAQETADAIGELYDVWNEETLTDLQRRELEISRFIEKVNLLRLQGLIQSDEDAQARIKDFASRMDPALKSIAAFQKQAAESIQSTLADAFYNGELSANSFLHTVTNVFRRIFAEAAALDLVKALGLDKIFSKQNSSSGSSATGSLLGAIGNLFAGFFTGGSASGGRASGLELVGEEGPEVVNLGGGAQVFNRRQLAFAGGGAPAFSPVTNILIEAREGDADALRAEFYPAIAKANARSQLEYTRLLERNGFGRLR